MDEGIGSKRIIIRRTSGLAIASMVLGISGIVLWFLTFGIPGFIGLPLGIAALVQIHKSGGTATGRNYNFLYSRGWFYIPFFIAACVCV